MSKLQPTSHTYSLSGYITGFFAAMGLTLLGYVLVNEHVMHNHQRFGHHALIYAVMALAVVQLFVQLYFFLHLGKEKKPRWNMIAFLFATGVVLILVIGSIWIMDHLNYNMMPRSPQDTTKYMHSQDGL